MIRIMDADFNRLGVIRNAIKAARVEELNGENTLAFEAILDTYSNAHINPNTVFELQNDYFDIAMYEKHANEDGTYTIEIEAEQVSYRLNEEAYNVEDFEYEGTPYDILSAILTNTGFTVGNVEFAENFKYEAGGEVSRRQLLMQFATALKGELIFDKFVIGIVKHRGTSERVPVVKDRHVKVISQMVDKRSLLPNGEYPIIYNCESVFLPNDRCALGDDILLMERWLSVREELRVVGITYNPYNSAETSFTFANGPMEYYSRGIERAIQNVDEQSVAENVKDAVLDEVEGSVVIADNAALMAGWPRYHIVDFFESNFAAIDASKPMSADNKRNFIRIYGQQLSFIQSELSGEIINYETPAGDEIYWMTVDGEYAHKYFTITDPVGLIKDGHKLSAGEQTQIRESHKVKVRTTIKEDVRLSVEFDTSHPNAIPKMIWGGGDENGNGKGFVYKENDGMYLTYTLRQPLGVLSPGDEVGMRITDAAIPEMRDPEDGEWKPVGSGVGGGGLVIERWI